MYQQQGVLPFSAAESQSCLQKTIFAAHYGDKENFGVDLFVRFWIEVGSDRVILGQLIHRQILADLAHSL